jgi:predicted dehydrogenase
MRKIKWGILSTAHIAVKKVIPAMQLCQYAEVTAIASRSQEKAQRVAQNLGIAKAYASYEALLAAPDIDAIYNPLPNHLHVSWSIRALEAGKHVLCEKPIGLSSAAGEQLLEAANRFPQLKIMEAFMYRHHPQWQLAKRLVDDGKIGDLKTIQSFFSYFNDDPNNTQSSRDWRRDLDGYRVLFDFAVALYF